MSGEIEGDAEEAVRCEQLGREGDGRVVPVGAVYGTSGIAQQTDSSTVSRGFSEAAAPAAQWTQRQQGVFSEAARCCKCAMRPK